MNKKKNIKKLAITMTGIIISELLGDTRASFIYKSLKFNMIQIIDRKKRQFDLFKIINDSHRDFNQRKKI
jgi:hypothetical protein